ncbi:unnamed protein product, partial [Mesorhabditis spiculigera]
MATLIPYISRRTVRSLHYLQFRPPYPFVKKGEYGQRKVGPVNEEKKLWPGQDKEFPELSPKFAPNGKKANPYQLHKYTGVQAEGYVDAKTGEFVRVPEMMAELVVPNLEGCKLRPYVSYRTDGEIAKIQKAYAAKVKEKGSEEIADLHTVESERWPPPKMTPKTLFDITYGREIRDSNKKA